MLYFSAVRLLAVLGALCMILSAALYRVVKKDKKTA